jgi:hypothetical protein
VAFCELRAAPSGVVGPVLSLAFSRLALICSMEGIVCGSFSRFQGRGQVGRKRSPVRSEMGVSC